MLSTSAYRNNQSCTMLAAAISDAFSTCFSSNHSYHSISRCSNLEVVNNLILSDQVLALKYARLLANDVCITSIATYDLE